MYLLGVCPTVIEQPVWRYLFAGDGESPYAIASFGISGAANMYGGGYLSEEGLHDI